MAQDLWKISYVTGTRESSMGHSDIFESETAMEIRLFDLLMEAAAGGRNKYPPDKERKARHKIKKWRRAFGSDRQVEKDDESFGVKKVIGLERLNPQTLEWDEQEWTLHHPYVTVEAKK